MGTRGRELVQINIEELITLLNKALADEWLAYYQYWIGAHIAKGPMRGAVAAELIEHANEELHHAELLTERIMQLGGTPILHPKEWFEKTTCGYDEPTDPSVKALLEQNIKGEQCAIDVYQQLTDLTRGKDEVTYGIVLEILGDEVEHEEDLEALLEDMQLI